MILFLCYVCPPMAVLLMGRPFSAVLNFFLWCMLWVPGTKHALVNYADWKLDQKVKQVTTAVHAPAWVTGGQSKRRRQVEAAPQPQLIDDPTRGAMGTRFKRK